MNKEKIKNFLKETRFCDFNHSEIAKIADDFKSKYKNNKQLAIALFYFVRDNTKYNVGDWTKTASETLSTGVGTCTNNANLLVALLRKAEIPAGYGIMKVYGREYFGVIVPKKLKVNISKISTHVYCYVYINNKWLKCDPSDDEPLSIGTQHLNPQSELVNWDGESHAMLNLHKDHIIQDRGPVDNIDRLISKKMKFYKKLPVKIANLYIDFLREGAKNINNVDLLEKNFYRWLKKKNYFFYFLYKYLFFWHNLNIFTK